MLETDLTVDATGLSCPQPILRLAKAVKKMDKGKTVHMIATDPGSEEDIPSWCKNRGHTLVERKIEDGKYHYIIQKN